MDLFTAFSYNVLKSILSHPFRDFFKKSQRSLKVLEQFGPSHAIYSRGLNAEAIGGALMDKQTGPKGFLVVLPGEIIEIPQDLSLIHI